MSDTSPHLTPPHLTPPHLTPPHLTSPHLISPHLTSSHLISCLCIVCVYLVCVCTWCVCVCVCVCMSAVSVQVAFLEENVRAANEVQYSESAVHICMCASPLPTAECSAVQSHTHCASRRCRRLRRCLCRNYSKRSKSFAISFAESKRVSSPRRSVVGLRA